MNTQTINKYIARWTGSDYSLIWKDEEGEVLVKGGIMSYKEALEYVHAMQFDLENKS